MRSALTDCICFPDFDLTSEVAQVYRFSNCGVINPFLIADRSELYGLGIRTSAEAQGRFNVAREPILKRARLARSA